MESTNDVQDYLRRFKVEEAVQAAVNSAIAHQAADPILHIADFLENLGKQLENAESAPEAEAQRSAS